jgi:pyridoxamine 5'-phosphate oxidase
MDKNLFELRRDYSMQELSESSAAADPFVQFGNWFEEYLNSSPLEPNAFVLSTADADGRPSSRVVLLKGFDPEVSFSSQTTKAKKRAIWMQIQMRL